MANSSEDLSERLSDTKKKVKFTGKTQDNISSSGPSSCDDDNEDLEKNPNCNVVQVQNLSNQNTSNSYITRKSKKRAVWELLKGYRDPNVKVQKPINYEGILLKRRNWPMKGWHKRYFILADGILTYGKSKADLTKNKEKPHGILNVYLSIVSYIQSKRRILIDSSTHSSAAVCHLKAKTQSEFDIWLELLKQHRLYYQYKSSQFNIDRNNSFIAEGSNANMSNINSSILAQQTFNLNTNNSSNSSTNKNDNNNLNPSSSFINVSSQIQPISAEDEANKNLQINLKIDHEFKNKKQNLIVDDNLIDNNFKQVEDSLMNLSKILSALYLSTLASSNSTLNSTQQLYQSGTSSQFSQFQPHHQHQPSTVSADYLTMNSLSLNNKIHSSKSNPNLNNNNDLLLVNKNNNNNNISTISNNNNTSNNLSSLNTNNFNSSNQTSNAIGNLITAGGIVLSIPPTININASSSPKISQKNLSTNSISNTSNNNNEDNKSRINFYNEAKSINDQLTFIYQQLLLKKQSLALNSNMQNSLQRSQRSQSVMSSVSLQDSQLQFYDAIEYLTSDSESDDDTDQESDNEMNEIQNKPIKSAIVPDLDREVSYDQSEEELQAQKILTRRRKLPATAPDASQVSVWGILRKAIGKDLSKISLPVILNEPLSILQRLCEELEYSDLLDSASNLQDPFDRMVYVAAFVISGYSSSYYRNGAKNFNPLLGETFEFVRPDKGWKYVAEQVSHHPPISSCHCQSKNFVHEQVFHAKIKFWGKSMEVHPEGYSRLTLPKFNETYQWNKIVMYVHNVMGTSRRIEHYGEITIRCTNGTTCTITFPKSSYSSQKNEFYGDVIYDNVVKRKIFGQWHESFLCGMDNTAKTIWRMGAMPEDMNLYYGFTRFAIELNEFTEDLKNELPPTDSRYRPDQRNLENGEVEKAELEKHRIEEKQRNKRKEMESKGEAYQPMWFSLSTDSLRTNTNEEKEWVFNNQYWIKRENPGFKNIKNNFPDLW